MPQRTCVACRKVKAKQELIRLVRISNGSVEVDTGGKKVGRGAYLCRVQECWESGLKGNQLEHALQAALTQNNREQLIRYGKDLL
ncbi:RNase P modulator RnpM [Chloroflexota bacterium]